MLRALMCLLLAAQDAPPVRVHDVRPEKAEVKVGETFRVAVDLEIPQGWHVYPAGKPLFGMPTEFAFEGAEKAGTVEEPAPKIHKDEILTYDYHEGKITLSAPIRLLAGPGPGPLEVKGRIMYQLCNADVCMNGAAEFALKVHVLEGKVDTGEGMLGLVLLGMLGGLISLFMPCTYPLVPITLTYFLKQAAGSRRHGLTLSSLYALGIIVTFTGLGLALTLLLGVGGPRAFAANPWVNVTVGALFLWFAGSLFGLYEVRLPFGMGDKLSTGPRKGAGGAFLLGLLFAVVTFTCTIPIAATILAMAAGQARLAALTAMVAYSATMAVPFFVMGLFPGLVKDIPKSGGWLNTLRVTMGFVEIVLAAVYFAKADQSWEIGVLGRPVVLGFWTGCCGITAVYLMRRPSIARAAFALTFLAFGMFMARGFVGPRLGLMEILVPPPPIEGTTLPRAFEEARRLNRPLFAEFTGLT